ncbi:MAG: PLP-dependent aspartate aminotransferase family protein [Acidobacteriota bacterium]
MSTSKDSLDNRPHRFPGETSRPQEELALDTRAIHSGEAEHRVEGAVAPPIFQSSTFEVGGPRAQSTEVRYIRLHNTPNHRMLHAKLAALAHGETALVTSSGMAAISAALLSVLQQGDRLLAPRGLYGGTHGLLTQTFPRFGISVDFIDSQAPETWEAALHPTTRAIYVESISNPLMEVARLDEVSRFAQGHGLVSLIDNTFLSPCLFRPLDLGYDLELHSATKILNGHSDVVAGVVIGSQQQVDATRAILDHLGGCLDPHAAVLLHRGIKTLGVRARQQSLNALALARALEEHPAVQRVLYPGLEDHRDHRRAAELFDSFGTMLSFEPREEVDIQAFLGALRLAIVAPSLGGVETLVTQPAATSHKGLSPQEREAAGISDSMVRVSVGLEDSADLVTDFSAALHSATMALVTGED